MNVADDRGMDVLEDPRADRGLLEAFGFDLPRWQRQADDIRQGRLTELTGTVRGRIVPMGAIPQLRFDQSADEIDCRRRGLAALTGGEVAVLIANGGLATRFGGQVKGVVEALPGRSFLALKLGDVADVERTLACRIPVVLMNSFATRERTLRHLEAHGHFGLDRGRVLVMDQTLSIRHELDGSAFVGSDGRFRYYAPGHGEFFERLRQSGLHTRLTTAGVRWLLFSNVDNLGASIEPRLLGYHIRAGSDMTVEVTEKRKDATGQWDVGGAPVVLDGQPQVVEGFRFPREFDQSLLPDIQTNTMWFSLGALAEELSIPPYLVRKRVDGRDSLTFEKVTCEASGIRRADGTPRLSLSLVRVPRDGLRGRFFPVKTPQDLEAIRPALAERVQQGRAQREREAAD
jgi:UTP--glucose-1-phosphate uridylyltransferase